MKASDPRPQTETGTRGAPETQDQGGGPANN